MIRTISATIAGVVLAFVVIALMDKINHTLNPPSEAIVAAAAERDMDAVRHAVQDWLKTAPQMALILIPVAWIAGAFWGALLASWIARRRSILPALVVGAVVLLATIANLRMLPHPAWIAIVGLGGIPPAALTAWWLIPRSKLPRPYDMREKNMAC
jgi:uncharacterized membrane protein YoaK (UPF0700 family)